MISGVYCIENVIDSKDYIGSSKKVNDRLNGHIENLRKNKHYIKELQNDWNKYGEENFKCHILETLNSSNRLDILKREQYFQDKSKSLYNKNKALTSSPQTINGLSFINIKNLCSILFREENIFKVEKNDKKERYEVYLRQKVEKYLIDKLLKKYPSCHVYVVSSEEI